MIKVFETNKGSKMVVEQNGDDFIITNEQNYYAYVQNARQIHRVGKAEGFTSLDETVEYVKQYF